MPLVRLLRPPFGWGYVGEISHDNGRTWGPMVGLYHGSRSWWRGAARCEGFRLREAR